MGFSIFSIFGVPKYQNVYQYDYHVKNLIIVIIASPLCTEG